MRTNLNVTTRNVLLWTPGRGWEVGGVMSVGTDAATNVSCETASNEDVCTPTEWRRWYHILFLAKSFSLPKSSPFPQSKLDCKKNPLFNNTLERIWCLHWKYSVLNLPENYSAGFTSERKNFTNGKYSSSETLIGWILFENSVDWKWKCQHKLWGIWATRNQDVRICIDLQLQHCDLAYILDGLFGMNLG